jgi:hypothetical protein
MQSLANWAPIVLSLPDFFGEPVVGEANVVEDTLIFPEAVEQASHFVALLQLGNNGPP